MTKNNKVFKDIFENRIKNPSKNVAAKKTQIYLGSIVCHGEEIMPLVLDCISK